MSGAVQRLSAAKRAQYRGVLDAVLAWSRRRDYRGFHKHDALASPFLAALFGRGKWLRIAAIQAVMRFPLNLRPVLGVPRTRNPKGIGLFAHALLDLWAVERDPAHLEAATSLLDSLLASPATGYRGLSWGYPYPWQDLGFFAPAGSPNRVVTCWIGLALAEATRATGEERYRRALEAIAEFLLEEPRVLHDDPQQLCLSYVPDPTVRVAVLDVPALVGAFLAEASSLVGREEWLTVARRLMAWVADKQTPYGAWFYTYPRGDSPVTHDNYHTAIILDCLDQYRVATGDSSFDGAYEAGLRFYAEQLFDGDGAPRWRNDRAFPRDVHGAASGILCLSRASDRSPTLAGQALSVLEWTLRNLYDPDGYFYYQRGRIVSRRYCLMRWCNAWMARALASLLRRWADDGTVRH